MARGHRQALGCTAFASYGAGWLQKAVVEAAHVEIRTEGRFGSRLEASMCMTMSLWIQGLPISSIDQTDIEWMLEETCRAALTDY